MKRLVLLGAAAVFALGTAVAADNPAAERQTLMGNVGAATGVGAKIAKGEMAFDAATAQLVLRTMNAAALGFGYMFPEGSETGSKTEAAPAIWSRIPTASICTVIHASCTA